VRTTSAAPVTLDLKTCKWSGEDVPMIMVVLRAAAVLIALFSLMNAAFNRDLAAFAFVHGLCALLGAIVAFLLAKFLNRSLRAGWFARFSSCS
jgi:hypothetical protein